MKIKKGLYFMVALATVLTLSGGSIDTWVHHSNSYANGQSGVKIMETI